MQLYGLDQNFPILAEEASRGKNYLCPECSSLLRVRQGPHRQAHFFHLRSQITCSQHRKTLIHLQAQLALKKILPEACLEKPFPSISRIADVAWEKEKLIFEIQYSSISREEVEARNRDYASLGWQVVWILHDTRYNKKRLSPAENFLRNQGAYFTNLDCRGRGVFYDQFEVLSSFRRTFKGRKLPVNFAIPQRKEKTLAFKGCLSDLLSELASDDPVHARLQKIRTGYQVKERPFFQLLASVKRFYIALFRAMLEKLCN